MRGWKFTATITLMLASCIRGEAASVQFSPSFGGFGIGESVTIYVEALEPSSEDDLRGEACGCNQVPDDVNWSLISRSASIGGAVNGSGQSGDLNTGTAGQKEVTGVAHFNWECPASYPNGSSSLTADSEQEKSYYNVSDYYVSAADETIGLNQEVEFTFHGPGNPNAESWSSDGVSDTGDAGKTFTTKWTTVGEKSVTAYYDDKSYTRPVEVTAAALVVTVTPGEKQVLWHEGPKEITFTASTNDTVSTDLSYSWSFGNGQTATGPTATVTFEGVTPTEGFGCKVIVTRGDGNGDNIAEKTVVAHVVKSSAFASQGIGGNLVTEAGDPLSTDIETTGIAADQLEYLLEIKSSSSNWYNEAGSLGIAEQDSSDPTKFEVKAKWFTSIEGGCAFSKSPSGAFDVPIRGAAKLKLTVRYNGAEIGTEDQTTSFQVKTPTGLNRMLENPDSYGTPTFTAQVTSPAWHAPTSSYRCEIQWNDAWAPKVGVVELDPAWALTQYAAKISAEETFHKGQWEGTQPRSVGGASDLYTKKGTLFLVGMAGNGPFYYYGLTAAEAESQALAVVAQAQTLEQSNCVTLWNDRRRLNEVTAKEHAGYTEGLTFGCTYDLPMLPNNGNNNHPAYE